MRRKKRKGGRPVKLPLGHDYGAGRDTVVHHDKRTKRKRSRRRDWSDDAEH